MSPTTPKDNLDLPGRLDSRGGPRERNIAVINNQIDSRDLFVTTRELIIGHGEERYRLRLTSQNKLILTK